MLSLRVIILSASFLLYTTWCSAQYIEIGASAGIATYQGDINPLAWRLSFQGARFAKGLAVGYHFNPYVGIKLRYFDSYLEAHDQLSLATDRRQRNLHFRSDLNEVSLVVDTELLNVIPWFSSHRLRPFASFGIAMFSFNPQAKLNGVWHDLQPLGTEGQGLPGYPKPYALTQLSIPIGGGFRYHVNKNVILAFEISPRITFTDYIDDVSTSYPDMELLREQRGQIAYDIAFQGDLLPNTTLTNSDVSGTGRGNPKENDWYITSTISFTYRLDPEFTISKKHKFAGYYRCPFAF